MRQKPKDDWKRIPRKVREFSDAPTADEIKEALLDLKCVFVRPGRVIDKTFLVFIGESHSQTFGNEREAITYARSVSDYVEGDRTFGEPVCCWRKPLVFVTRKHAL